MAIHQLTRGKTRLGPQTLGGSLGGGASAALVQGGGTTVAPCTSATPNKNFLGYFVKSTATSGDTRGLYTRLYVAGAGGSGEAGRFYTTVDNVTAATGGTVNGAHISLNITGASGKVSGSANALRATFDIAATPTTVGGTCAVARFDTNIATGPTIPTRTAFIAVDNLGAQSIDYLLNITNPSAAMVASAGTGAGSPGQTGGMVAGKALKVTVGGVDHWIPLCISNS